MPKYAENYEELINEIYLQLEELTTERDELRAALKEYREQAEADYISLQEAYLQCQKDLYAESEQLEALKAKIEDGVRVAVMRHGSMYTFNNTFAPKNATLILDDGVKI